MQIGPEHWLKKDFIEKKKKNKSYSLRAYSQYLSISPSRLSQILNGKRKISFKMALKILEKLQLNPVSQQHYLNSLKENKVLNQESDENQLLVEQRSFDLIADPIHFAVLSLMECDDFISDENWMALRLNVDEWSIKAALENLMALKFIKMEKGQYQLGHQSGFKTTDHQINLALRKSHKIQLEKAIGALDEIPLELRDFTSEFMAIDPTLLPEAKNLIREFRGRLAKLLESQKKQEVYQLSIQLIPLTKIDLNKGKFL